MINEIKGLYGAWRDASPEAKENVKNTLRESFKESLRELVFCGALCTGVLTPLLGLGAIIYSTTPQSQNWQLSQDGRTAKRETGFGLVRIVDSDNDPEADYREISGARVHAVIPATEYDNTVLQKLRRESHYEQ